MPELPEVEIIKLNLQRKLVGLKIQKIDIPSQKSFLGESKHVIGQKVLKLERKAKLLIIDLSGNLSLLFHLKMSGQLVWVKAGDKFIGGHPTEDMFGGLPNKSTRVIFDFSDGSKLYFNDQRKFGWIKIVDRQQVAGNILINRLGPEPLEKGFTWQVLKENLQKHKSQPVKIAIMDQSVISGVGNIYANEACFNAKIDPSTKVEKLTDKQLRALHEGIIRALKDGIKYGGSTRVHFVDPEGHKGYFLDYAYVYGRDKHPCRICKTEIKKIRLDGRGTYFCSHCQR